MEMVAKNIKILIAEDERLIALDLKNILSKLGYKKIILVYNGNDAVTAAKDEKPDLVLMDIIMDGNISGIEAAKKIKSINIPVIYITASTDKQTLDEALKTEPIGIITKPFSITHLKEIIERALQ